jgi:2-oxoglutarate ferredoxin oxidoreductase subunit alpha
MATKKTNLAKPIMVNKKSPVATNRPFRLMQGNEAVAIGALDAGVNFFAGYPITPSTEIAEILSYELPKRGGVLSKWKMRLPVSVLLPELLWQVQSL